jgi:hypothetical protein
VTSLLLLPVLAVISGDPPLDPSPDDARSSLRRELARPEYHEVDWRQRIEDWITRRFDDSVGAAQDVPPLGTFAGILVLLLLALGIGLLVSRARRTARAKAERAPALTDEQLTAADLRRRAEAALAEERYGDALVDAFRALAVRQIERDRIEDLPHATAHELARALGTEFPAQRHLLERSADLFDEVLYGDHPASREQALDVLALDDELAGRRVRR